jgi:hypothetical protein
MMATMMDTPERILPQSLETLKIYVKRLRYKREQETIPPIDSSTIGLSPPTIANCFGV